MDTELRQSLSYCVRLSLRVEVRNSDRDICSFPEDLPLGTSVPSWAYENVTTQGDTFILIAALALAGHAAESSATSVPPSIQTNAPSGSRIGNNTKSGSATGAIAAGTVAGVVGTLFLLTVLFLRCRSRVGAHFIKAMEEGKERAVKGGVTPLILENGLTEYSPEFASVLYPILKKSEKIVANSSGPNTSQANEVEHTYIDLTINEPPSSTGGISRPDPPTNIIDLTPPAESEHADPPPQYVRTQLCSA